MDHACSTTYDDSHLLTLSSEGCPNSWGVSNRDISECPAAWATEESKLVNSTYNLLIYNFQINSKTIYIFKSNVKIRFCICLGTLNVSLIFLAGPLSDCLM